MELVQGGVGVPLVVLVFEDGPERFRHDDLTGLEISDVPSPDRIQATVAEAPVDQVR
jgi:hypothetical protein